MRRFALPSLATALLGGLVSPARADDAAAAWSLAPVATRAGLSLLAVLAAIAALAFLLRRFGPGVSGRTPGTRLASIARLDLGSRREIRIVEADGRKLLVGVGPDRVQLLTELPSATSAEAPAEQPPLRVIRELTTSL